MDNKERRAVAGVLIEFDAENGVPVYVIGAAASLTNPEAEEILVLLEFHQEAERLLPLATKAWRITDYGRKAYRDDRFASKLRKCLNCNKQFDSSHAGNRICEKCLDSDFNISDTT